MTHACLSKRPEQRPRGPDLSAQLSAWEREGWLRREEEHLVLLQPERLAELTPSGVE